MSRLIATLLLLLLSPTISWAVPGLLRGPYIQLSTSNSIVIRWRTEIAGESHLMYGASPGSPTSTLIDSTPKTEHEVVISGLDPDTTYYYSVGSELTEFAGNDSDHFFRTHPTPGTSKPVRIWAMADSGNWGPAGDNNRDGYLAYMDGTASDVWIMGGDNAYVWGTDLEYTTWMFDRFQTILRNSVVWPTLGSHDTSNGYSDPVTQTGVYFDAFNLPTAAEAGGLASGTEEYYSFDYGDVHFLSINTNGSNLNDIEAWLAADLEATDAAWTIGYWYHVPYSKGSHDTDNPGNANTTFRQSLLPIIESYGVDLVLGGHSHVYERSMLLDGHYGFSSEFDPEIHALDTGDGDPNGSGPYLKPTARMGPHEGTVYMTIGVAAWAKTGTLDHPAMITSIGEIGGTVVIDIDGSTLDTRFIDANGAVLDHFQIIKGFDETPSTSISATLVLVTSLACAGFVIVRKQQARLSP